MGDVELARRRALAAPGLEEIPVRVEPQHARIRLAVPLRHIEVAARADRHVIRLVEQRQVAIDMPLAGGALRRPSTSRMRPCGLNFTDVMRADIGDPDIVVGVDPQPVRPGEKPVRHAADEAPVGDRTPAAGSRPGAARRCARAEFTATPDTLPKFMPGGRSKPSGTGT